MSIETQAFQVDRLRGMDERWRRDPSTADLLRDMTWDDRDGWRVCGGYRRLVRGDFAQEPGLALTPTNPYVGAGTVISLAWFAQHNGARQFLIYESGGGELRMFNGSKTQPWDVLEDAQGNLQQNRQVVSGAWAGTTSQAWGGRLFLVNGYDAPLVFDGTKVERAGFDGQPPPPGGSVINDNGNRIGAWRTSSTAFETIDAMGLGALAEAKGTLKCAYRYVVTFTNERGQESPVSAAGGLVVFSNSDVARQCLMVTVPTGGDHVVARRVYRTRNLMDSAGEIISLGYGDNYYFLMEIQDNETTAFEDSTPDGLLGSLVDELDFGVFPTNTKYMAVFSNTMFIAGGTPNSVLFSAPLFPEVYPPDNVLEVGESDMGPITGMYPTKGALVVFKQRGIFLIRGSPAEGFVVLTLTRDVGCHAPKSIRELPGLGLAFLADDGVYLLEGALQNEGTPTRVIKLSQPLSVTTRDFNPSALAAACAEVYHHDREYWLAIPTLGSTEPDIVLVYHYDIGAWSVREDFPIACMVETHDQRGYLIFGSHEQVDHPGLHVYSRGFLDKDGDALRPLYRSSTLDFGMLYRNVRPRYINLYLVAYGDNDVELNYRANRSIDTIRVVADKKEQQSLTERFPVLDKAKWDGGDKWSEYRPVVVRYDIGTGHKGPVHEIDFEVSWAARNGQIVGYDIEVETGELRKIRALNDALAPPRR
jgi:hypothetical protein